MEAKSWGNFPKYNSALKKFNFKNLKFNFSKNSIPFGNGRSYGDSALAKNIIKIDDYNKILSFNELDGVIHVQSGILISEIVFNYVPKGWFLKVTPGTKFITVGGAIASDVHGKNHNKAGCFSRCIEMFNLLLPNGEIYECSMKKNIKLFKATCGGMGLTGIILDVKFKLKKVNSKFINQITIKTNNLKETFDAFYRNIDSENLVAWIDCNSDKNLAGRSLLKIGNFCNDGNLNLKRKKTISIPTFFPSIFTNKIFIKIFNFIYYHINPNKISYKKIELDSFFYSLDYVNNWNRFYGKKGLIQYQFILPMEHSLIGIGEILNLISESKIKPTLAVLKVFGKQNKNFMSFPIKGYSLAIDFKIQSNLFKFLDQLDEIIIKYKGRIYLSKDARVNSIVFEKGYPEINIFRQLRTEYGLKSKLNSFQSERLKI